MLQGCLEVNKIIRSKLIDHQLMQMGIFFFLKLIKIRKRCVLCVKNRKYNLANCIKNIKFKCLHLHIINYSQIVFKKFSFAKIFHSASKER